MAVGHARERERADLLRKLVAIGDQRPSQRRRYHLLGAASLENATTLDPAVRAEVISRAAFLIPPATREEAENLAQAGAVVLDVLSGPADMTEEQAVASVRTIGLIGGRAALDHVPAAQGGGGHGKVARVRCPLPRLHLNLHCRPRRAPLDLSRVRGIDSVTVRVRNTTKIIGLDGLDPDQVSVTVAGRRTGGLLTSFRDQRP
ncbi:hypothetical protein ABZV24_11320 [Streptomyces sp. NPDC005251]|uniref:hypothetical protein n=1 Tax=Streptomyces sp. NPDC005251 TaxID=3157166 RepID=UPI0033B44951